MDEQRYTLLVVDGELADLCDAATQSIRYAGLSKAAVSQIAELSLAQGLAVAVWCEDGGADV